MKDMTDILIVCVIWNIVLSFCLILYGYILHIGLKQSWKHNRYLSGILGTLKAENEGGESRARATVAAIRELKNEEPAPRPTTPVAKQDPKKFKFTQLVP